MMSLRSLMILGITSSLLFGCGGLREDLGLGRNPPDEFAVVDRPPLSMPPDFDLRPPEPGAPRPQSVDMTRRASDVLFNGDTSSVATDGNTSDSEKALIEQMGGDKANPDIRRVVDSEASQKVVSTKHLVDELLWWKSDERPATTVDAAGEAARIKDAKEKGESLNKGATPVIERQETGWLGL